MAQRTTASELVTDTTCAATRQSDALQRLLWRGFCCGFVVQQSAVMEFALQQLNIIIVMNVKVSALQMVRK